MIVGGMHDISFKHQYIVVGHRGLARDCPVEKLVCSTQMGLSESGLFIARLVSLDQKSAFDHQFLLVALPQIDARVILSPFSTCRRHVIYLEELYLVR
jgi:hypothetical protein